MRYNKSFLQYTDELSNKKYDPLSVTEERQALADWKAGSREAFDKILHSNLRFVVFSLKYHSIPKNVDVMDLIQEGNMGLMEGIVRYDPTRYKCRVFTYCFWWIRFFITRCLRDTGKFSKIFVPYPIEDSLEFSELDLVDTSVDFSSYYGEVAKDIQDYIEDCILDEKSRKVITLFFGLEYPFVPKTLEDIGSMLHLSIERVRQIKKLALELLAEHKEKFYSLM
jgi:RNA polymerase sigma factor (sigma-70 family)